MLALEHSAHEYAELCEQLVRYRLAYLATVEALAMHAQQTAAYQRRTAQLIEENRTLRRDVVERLNTARAHYRRLHTECSRLRAALMQQDQGGPA